jgi:hypothetical protein
MSAAFPPQPRSRPGAALRAVSGISAAGVSYGTNRSIFQLLPRDDLGGG